MNIRLNSKLIKSLSNVLAIPHAEMMAIAAINRSTWYRIVQNPFIITVQQMLAIANGLHVPVRRFFSTDRTDYIGQRDDYITEPYLPCHYDDDALQEIVSNRPGATWQKAADVTGMTRDNLRNSLLAVTRTPVTRFLIVCAAFDIDPFTILIDPNPELKRVSRRNAVTSTDGSDAALRAEIAALQDGMRTLSAAVANLTQKYETLLADHEKLARRVSVSIDTINNSYIGIAAEK